METETAIIVNSIDAIHRLPPNVSMLKGDGLGDREVIAIAALLSLKELDLSGCEAVTDRSVAELHQLLLLEKLDLSFCNQITDSALKALSALPVLRFLNLNWCYGVTDDGLCAVRRCESLESVSLWSCESISDSGVAALATLPHLRILELPEFAHITDRALAALSTNAASVLESLRLDHLSEISNQGFTQLGALQTLRVLTVQSCPGITPDAVNALRGTIPQCVIDYKS